MATWKEVFVHSVIDFTFVSVRYKSFEQECSFLFELLCQFSTKNKEVKQVLPLRVIFKAVNMVINQRCGS